MSAVPSEPDRAAPPPASKTPPPWQVLSALLSELPGLVSDRVHLLSLEVKRAGRTLVELIVLVLGAAILLATGWLALWGAFTAALVEAGLGWGWAFLVTLLINLGAGAWALLRARRMAPLLGLPATLRHLTPARQPAAPADSAQPTTATPASAAASPQSTTTAAAHG